MGGAGVVRLGVALWRWLGSGFVFGLGAGRSVGVDDVTGDPIRVGSAESGPRDEDLSSVDLFRPSIPYRKPTPYRLSELGVD